MMARPVSIKGKVKKEKPVKVTKPRKAKKNAVDALANDTTATEPMLEPVAPASELEPTSQADPVTELQQAASLAYGVLNHYSLSDSNIGGLREARQALKAALRL
jgi:hypothetical protein